MWLRFLVPPEAQGMPLRNFLHACAVSTELTRAVKYQGGGFFLDGKPVHTNILLGAGQTAAFELPPEQSCAVRPQPALAEGLRIVYEDALAVVLDKPAGIAVHPTLNYPDGTLANAWSAWAQARGESGVFRPVNRLDKNTSGLLLAARNMYAAPLLAGSAEKQYIAIAEGELPLGAGVFDAPIGRRGDSIIGRCVTPDGKPSRTEYTVEQAKDGLSLAVCRPVTGRTHQIRVHFSAAGHPLAGDTLYGGDTTRIARHALHCGRMTFLEPVYEADAQGLTFSVPLRYRTVSTSADLPPDMKIL